MMFKIKLKRRHPEDAMFFGRYTVSNDWIDVDLNAEEMELLGTEGPDFWFEYEKKESKPQKKSTKSKE